MTQNLDLEVDGAEAGVADEHVAAGLADAVHEAVELVALLVGEGVGADRVGRDEGGRPAAGPPLAHAGDLDPVEAPGDLTIVLGLDRAVSDGAELLGRELADVVERLGVDAVAHRQRIGDAGDPNRGDRAELGAAGPREQADRAGADVAGRAGAGAVEDAEHQAVGRGLAEFAVAEANGGTVAAGVVEVHEVLVDGGALKADDAAPDAVVEGEVVVERQRREEGPPPRPPDRGRPKQRDLRDGLPQILAEPPEAGCLGGQEAVQEGDAALAGLEAQRALALDRERVAQGRIADGELLAEALAGSGGHDVAVDKGVLAEPEAPREGVLGVPGQVQEVDAHQLVGDVGRLDADEVPPRRLSRVDGVAVNDDPLVVPVARGRDQRAVVDDVHLGGAGGQLGGVRVEGVRLERVPLPAHRVCLSGQEVAEALAELEGDDGPVVTAGPHAGAGGEGERLHLGARDLYVEEGGAGAAVVDLVVDEASEPAEAAALSGGLEEGLAGHAVLGVRELVAERGEQLEQHDADVGLDELAPLRVALAGELEESAAQAEEVAGHVVDREVDQVAGLAGLEDRLAVDASIGAIGLEGELAGAEEVVDPRVRDRQAIAREVARLVDVEHEHVVVVVGVVEADIGDAHDRHALASGGADDGDVGRRRVAVGERSGEVAGVAVKVDPQHGLARLDLDEVDAGQRRIGGLDGGDACGVHQATSTLRY
ncbi:hypothetical protein [Nannocystis pusilla]|uniref:hypothetical protein n=1 Tax=Nannocystis pusilla TaxID=889268 RepID=UPI003DA5FE38